LYREFLNVSPILGITQLKNTAGARIIVRIKNTKYIMYLSSILNPSEVLKDITGCIIS
jgi:hypothetical protein